MLTLPTVWIFKNISIPIKEDNLLSKLVEISLLSSRLLLKDFRLNFLNFQFYESCPKWLKEVDDSEASLVEQKRFETSTEMISTLSSVAEKLGFETLPLEDVLLLYDICRYLISYTAH